MSSEQSTPEPPDPENEPAPPSPIDNVDGLEGEDLDFGRTVLQFFVIPAFVVALCVGVFFFFAWLVSDEKTGVDYLNEIRAGSANRRWQAAFELSKIITMDDEKRRMEGLVPEMIRTFESASDDDERVRHYLALSLGHLRDPSATPALVAALDDSDPSTRLYSSWALGNIGDRSAVTKLIETAGDDDPGVRKMAVYALGAIGDPVATSKLEVALSDPDRDVSWNAAVSLAQLGSDAGESQLLQMLDQDFLDGIDGMNEAQKLLATESALRASALVENDALERELESIASDHPNLTLRELALSALEELQKIEKMPSP